MKSFTGLSQVFDKCTKATFENNYFWGTPPDDCLCLETWSRYYDNIKCRKFKTILIWKSSRKMNKNKNLLISYYLWKKLSEFSNAQKKVFHAFSFQLCSTANSKFSFYVSLCAINCIEIQTISLVLNLSILAEIFCVLFTSSQLNFFFQSREWNKNMWSCATTNTGGHAQRSYLTVARLWVA